MSPVLMPLLVAIATLGVALAALIVGLFAWVRSDMRRMEDRLVSRFESDMRRMEDRLVSRSEQVEARFVSRFEQVEARLATVEHGQAKLEGLLEGLREAIVARAA